MLCSSSEPLQYKTLSAGNLVVVKNLYFSFLHLFYKTELTGTANTHTNVHTNIEEQESHKKAVEDAGKKMDFNHSKSIFSKATNGKYSCANYHRMYNYMKGFFNVLLELLGEMLCHLMRPQCHIIKFTFLLVPMRLLYHLQQGRINAHNYNKTCLHNILFLREKDN